MIGEKKLVFITSQTIDQKNLDRFQNLYAAAGHPNAIFKINFKNLQTMTFGKIMDITE